VHALGLHSDPTESTLDLPSPQGIATAYLDTSERYAAIATRKLARALLGVSGNESNLNYSVFVE
jgi:hypothetical protein